MHNERLYKVLLRLKENNVTLNFDKCLFKVTSFSFLGVLIDEKGISPDPGKVEAITQFQAPSKVSEVRRFLGMFNQVSKFVPNVSQETTPIRTLLQKERAFVWGPEQEECFQRLKKLLVSSVVLGHYDPKKETRIETDASAFGVGCVMFQRHDNEWRPVAYASRSITETESRWGVIEKEMLAICFACSRFRDFLVGLDRFEI